MCEFRRHNFLKNLRKETEIRQWSVIFHVTPIVCGLFQQRGDQGGLEM